MNFLIVAATPFEVAGLQAHLQRQLQAIDSGRYQSGEVTIDFLITGVGLPLAAFHLGRQLAANRYQLAVQLGVGGAYDRALPLGSLAQMASEQFADLGVEEADGRFTTALDMGLTESDKWPFREGRLWQSDPPFSERFPSVHGLSVNCVSGTAATIAQRRQRFPDAQVETMEGAAFFYACLLSQQPMLQIRALSNYVEPRQRANWRLAEAIETLNAFAVGMVEAWLELGSDSVS